MAEESGAALANTTARRANSVAQRRVAVWTGLVLVMIAFAKPLLVFCRSVSVMYVFTVQQQVPTPVRAFRKLADTPTTLTEIQIPGRRGEVKVRSYAPSGRTGAPVMLLVHGLVPDGRLDNGLNILAQKLAENGFRVFIPEIATERDGLMRPDALYNIGDAIHYARSLNGGPISAVGVSFGGGLLLRAAAMPEYSQDVRSILCISAYNSLLRIGHYYIGDAVEGPSGERYADPPVASGSLLMAYQYLGEFVAPNKLNLLQATLPKLLASINTRNVVLERDLLAKLPAGSARRIEDLSNPAIPAIHQEFEAMLERHSEENRFISPHGNLGQLRATVYILHGRSDAAIPVGEAEWNCREIETTGQHCHLEVTPWLHHALLDKHARLRDKVQVSYFVSRFLTSAAQ